MVKDEILAYIGHRINDLATEEINLQNSLYKNMSEWDRKATMGKIYGCHDKRQELELFLDNFAEKLLEVTQ